MDKHTNRHRAALLVGLLATGIEAADAADWTQRTDLTATEQGNGAANEVILTGPHGFSVGTSFAITPDGQRVGAVTAPEQFGTDQGNYYSSKRGKLWSYGAYNFTGAEIDGAGNVWAGFSSDFFSGLSSVVRLGPDGASPLTARTMDAQIEYRPTFAALRDRAGALVGNCTADNGVLSGALLNIDAQGQTRSQHATPGCPTRIVDDGSGGAYLSYRRVLDGPVTTTRITATGAVWKEPLANSEPLAAINRDAVVIAAGGDIELRAADGVLIQHVAQADVTSVAAYDSGFWVAGNDRQRLIHVDLGGQARNVDHDRQVLSLHVLDNGLLLVRDLEGLTLYSPQGQRLADRRALAVERAATRVFARNGIVSTLAGRTLTVRSIDGTAVDRTLALTGDGAPDLIDASASRICVVQSTMHDDALHATLDCFARDDGRLLFSASHPHTSLPALTGPLMVDDGQTILQIDETVHVYDDNGTLRFALSGATRPATYDARFGIAFPRAGEIAIHDTDGSLRARSALPADFDPQRLIWMEDGGLLVSGQSNGGAALRRLDGNGMRLGLITDFAAPGFMDMIDTGSTILATARFDRGEGPAQLLRLDRTTLATLSMDPTPGPDTRFWRGTNGQVWLSGRSEGRVGVLQLDASGQVLGRRVLPLAKGDVVHVSEAGQLGAVQARANSGEAALLTHLPSAMMSTTPLAQSVLGGAWYSPESTGQGLFLHPLNDGKNWFAAWHTFDSSGDNRLSKQQWLTIQGDVHDERGAITLPIYRNRNGGFDLAGRTTAEAVGSAELHFLGCDRLEFWWRIGDDAGALPLQRLTPRTKSCNDGQTTLPPADSALAIDLSGPWYDPSRSGQGLALTTSGARFKQFLAGWFTYDVDGNSDDADAQHWFTVQGAAPSRYGETATASVFRTTGGSRNGQPTRNTHQVGSALLTVHDCAHATLEYVFDDSVVAAAFANRNRVVPLTRLGTCNN